MEKRALRIVSTGVAVPERVLTAQELDRQLGVGAGESFRVTGIRRRHVAVGETAAALGAEACRAAMARAKLGWEEVDCLVAASGTMDQALPYNAALIHAELGLEGLRTTTLDIGASCLSFLQALDFAASAITVGRFRNILVVSSDIASFTADFRNLREGGIFGDGAAAAVLGGPSGGEGGAVLATESVTLSEGVNCCRVRACGSRFHRRGDDDGHARAVFEMKGRSLFGLVARELPGFVEGLLRRAGVTQEEIRMFVPHQASQQALRRVARLLGFDDGRMVDIFGDFGNQVGASLPSALHHGLEQGRVKRGDRLLLLGTGAGVAIGGIILEY